MTLQGCTTTENEIKVAKPPLVLLQLPEVKKQKIITNADLSERLRKSEDQLDLLYLQLYELRRWYNNVQSSR